MYLQCDCIAVFVQSAAAGKTDACGGGGAVGGGPRKFWAGNTSIGNMTF